MTLAAGTRIGVYEVSAPLGAGGMGEVYRARDSKLNRDVALKVLPAALAADPDRLARFTREAQTLAALNHPNIAAHLRRRGEQRRPRADHGAGRRRRSLGADRPRPSPAGRSASDRQTDRRGTGSRARARHRPSRPQARQHQGPRRRHREGARLRPRQSARSRTSGGRDVRQSRRVGRKLADDHHAGDDGGGHDPRHGRLHGARAGARQGRRQAGRHLGLWRRPLRDAHRHAAVRRRVGGRDARPDLRPRARPDEVARRPRLPACAV